MIKVFYETKAGCFMDILGTNEIDTQSPAIRQVYKIEIGKRILTGDKARKYLKNIKK